MNDPEVERALADVEALKVKDARVHELGSDCWCGPTVEHVGGVGGRFEARPEHPVIGEVLLFHPAPNDHELLTFQRYDPTSNPNPWNRLVAFPMVAIVTCIGPDALDTPTLLVFPPLGPPISRTAVRPNDVIHEGVDAGAQSGGWMRRTVLGRAIADAPQDCQ